MLLVDHRRAWACLAFALVGSVSFHRRMLRRYSSQPIARAAMIPTSTHDSRATRRAYASAGHNGDPNGTEVPVMAHAKDKGEKQAKKTAQKSIKEKRAAKKAKKSSTARSE